MKCKTIEFFKCNSSNFMRQLPE